MDSEKSNKPQLIHKLPTPRAGGIGIYIGALFLIFNPLGWKILVAALPAFIVGLYDDFSSLKPNIRLVFQLVSAILSVVILQYTITTIGFGVFIPYILGSFIAIIAIVGLTNAMNIIDGFHGLSSGISVLVLLSMGVISWVLDDILILEIIIVNLVSILCFMFYNYPKGKIFLGDGGAFYLGFLLSSIVLLLCFRHSEISIYYSLSILSYPIFEVLFSMYRKQVVDKTSFFQPDKKHLHMLIYKKITKQNYKTSLFIWIRVFPFMVFATIFYQNSILLLLNTLVFVLYYVYLYQTIIYSIKGKKSN
jgi:UDP-N-acetylmuramyl pentapeptide phosphotransferase/UDP-N-acetylglucosamine-1-phosphate transferase